LRKKQASKKFISNWKRTQKPPTTFGDWEAFVRFAANPKVPTLEEAMREVLTAEAIARLTAHLRSLVDAGQGTSRSALAYLWAVKK
jgi:hypothetical protein